MKNLKSIASITLVIFFNLVFYKEKIGLNFFLFELILYTFLFLIDKKKFYNKKMLVVLLCAVFVNTMVILNNSSLSITMAIITHFLFVGMYYEKEVKTIYEAIIAGVLNHLISPVAQIFQFKSSQIQSSAKKRRSIYYFKITILPLLVFFLFYIIYNSANPTFNELCNKFWARVGGMLTEIFKDISLVRIGFLILSIITVIPLFHYKGILGYFNFNKQTKEELERKKGSGTGFSGNNPIALKNFFKSGLFLFGILNLLILLVNITDISTVWFGFRFDNPNKLSQFVHEGTYMLILSIILSIIVVLIFFKGNLNFYKENKTLKILAYVWIVQNCILAASVAIRNFYYIGYYGLAYKRIGVIIFLIMTIAGLITLVLKIKQLKSAFYLYRLNSLLIYTIVILCTSVNWDVFIADYNLNKHWNPEKDIDFLLSLSDKALPYLNENRKQISTIVPTNNFKEYDMTESQYLDMRIEQFKDRYKNSGIMSWNYADHKAYQLLINSSK